MQWYYLDTDQQQTPCEEEHLGTLIQNGTLRAETMLWNETMTGWETAQSLWPDSYEAPAAAPVKVHPHPSGGLPVLKRKGSPTGRPSRPATRDGASRGSKQEPEEDDEKHAATRRFAGILRNYNGWFIFVAIMSILTGVLNALMLGAVLVSFGEILLLLPILVSLIPIMFGVTLFQVVSRSRKAVETGFPENLDEAIQKLGAYFIWLSVLYIIFLLSIAFMVIAILAGFQWVQGLTPPEF